MDLVFQASWPALWAALLSPQGIIASCLFCIGVLGFLLFQDMGENLRSSLLSLALFGLLALAYSYLQFSQPATPLAHTSPLLKSLLRHWKITQALLLAEKAIYLLTKRAISISGDIIKEIGKAPCLTIPRGRCEQVMFCS